MKKNHFMNRSQMVSEKIMAILNNPVARENSELLETAEEYGALCRNYNTRSEQAVNQMNLGYFSDAMRIVTMFHLVDDYKYLSFPRRADWKNDCANLGFEIPPELNHDNAARIMQLEGRMTAELNQLLKRHRQLAFEHPETTARLNVLYQLHKLETDNPVWLDMILMLEKKRDNEIAAEFSRTPNAIHAIPDLRLMLNDLKSPNRQSPLPEQLFGSIKRGLESLEYKKNLGDVSTLADNLSDAWLDHDAEMTKRYAKDWIVAYENYRKCLAPGADMSALKLIYDKIAEPMAWYNKWKPLETTIQRFKDVKTHFLQTAAAKGTTLGELVDSYSEVETTSSQLKDLLNSYKFASQGLDFEYPITEDETNIPESMMNLYDKRYEKLRRGIRKDRALLSMKAMAISCLIICVIVWGAQRKMKLGGWPNICGNGTVDTEEVI